jgi:tetratricopeptide (TPR) repeat protein
MGAVYEAWDPVLERKVAIKAVCLGGVGKEEALARFRREAMALAQLNHPNVCQIHDWVEARGGAYIAMEFIEGETLATAGMGMDVPRKLQVLRAIARALEAAHAKGLVHRDLKPSNVMVDARGNVKVLDFGLARLADAGQAQGPSAPSDEESLPQRPALSGDDLTLAEPSHVDPRTSLGSPSQPDMTEAGVFMGTPSYASPEQIVGQRVGPPSDVFSLGLVAWELLQGEAAFPGRGREHLTATLCGEPRPMKLRLPRRIGGLLRAMLCKDPAKRPTATEVAAILGRQLGGAPLTWWIGGAASVLAVLLGFGYLLFGRSIIADLGRGGPPRLVILPIQNETGDASLDALVNVGMTELLATALRGSSSLAVVEPGTVARVMAGLHLSASGARKPGSGLRIAKAVGARLLLRGQVRQEPHGSTLVFTYELVDAKGRTRLEGSDQMHRTTPFEPYPLVDPAAHTLLRKVAPLESSGAEGAPISPAVFEAYATGLALFRNGDFKGSEAPLREAAMRAPGFADAVSAYAACLRRLGEDPAPLAANWALMSAKATGNRWAEVQALALKAYLAKDRGDLDTSQQLREQSLDLAHTIGDVDGEIAATNHLGLIAAERGQDAQARAFYERALKLSEETGLRFLQALCQNNLANLDLQRGETDIAAGLYQGTLQIQRDLGNRWGEALALNNLGVLALMSRDLPRAEALLSKALTIREAVGDRSGEATCLRNLGILAQMKGNTAASAAYLAQALDLAQQAGLRTVAAECLFYQADLERMQRRFPLAREGFQKVLTLLPSGVTPEVRDNAQAGLAECLVRQAHPDLKKAGQLLAAISSGDADSPIVHRARAWLARASGQPGLALAQLDRALADPQHDAPQIHAELEATRAEFLKGAR